MRSAQQPAIEGARETRSEDNGSLVDQEPGIPPNTIELVRTKETITASLKALAKKYSLAEITLATDDGLLIASSSDRDVMADVAKFSQIAMEKSIPDEPEVTLFELDHKGSHLVGIIRTKNKLRQNWKTGIQEDTKGILQWWL
ncbi:MAG: hypothetical protein A4E35_01192 [Methanoregula sp. PtaU1.Bin051]|nr:MAG: hypothetical protein A4E35_01192 [Methanoregula sp. PtaU1.Bin051]